MYRLADVVVGGAQKKAAEEEGETGINLSLKLETFSANSRPPALLILMCPYSGPHMTGLSCKSKSEAVRLAYEIN
jgi:hypothetical protein